MTGASVRRAGRRAEETQQRIRSLYDAARATRGAVELMLESLGIEIANFRHRISVMKARGWAQTTDLYDPAQCGWPVRTRCLVALRREHPDAEATFERYCHGEASVTNAVCVSGRYDYQLTIHHPSIEQALAWADGLGRRPEIADVAQQFTDIVFGHELRGLPLALGGGERPVRRSRGA